MANAGAEAAQVLCWTDDGPWGIQKNVAGVCGASNVRQSSPNRISVMLGVLILTILAK